MVCNIRGTLRAERCSYFMNLHSLLARLIRESEQGSMVEMVIVLAICSRIFSEQGFHLTRENPPEKRKLAHLTSRLCLFTTQHPPNENGDPWLQWWKVCRHRVPKYIILQLSAAQQKSASLAC